MRRYREPLKVSLAVDGDTLRSRWEQPGGEEIIKENLRQQHESPARRSDFIQPLARIPVLEKERWRREGREDLLRGDKRAMERFLASSEGRAFRTTPRGRSRAFSFGGIGRGKMDRT